MNTTYVSTPNELEINKNLGAWTGSCTYMQQGIGLLLKHIVPTTF